MGLLRAGQTCSLCQRGTKTRPPRLARDNGRANTRPARRNIKIFCGNFHISEPKKRNFPSPKPLAPSKTSQQPDISCRQSGKYLPLPRKKEVKGCRAKSFLRHLSSSKLDEQFSYHRHGPPMACSKVGTASSACMGRAAGAIRWPSNDSDANRVRGSYLGACNGGARRQGWRYTHPGAQLPPGYAKVLAVRMTIRLT